MQAQLLKSVVEQSRGRLQREALAMKIMRECDTDGGLPRILKVNLQCTVANERLGRFEGDGDLKSLTGQERLARLLLLKKGDRRFPGKRFPTLKPGDPGVVAIGHEQFQVGGPYAPKNQSSRFDPKDRCGFSFAMHGAGLPNDQLTDVGPPPTSDSSDGSAGPPFGGAPSSAGVWYGNLAIKSPVAATPNSIQPGGFSIAILSAPDSDARPETKRFTPSTTSGFARVGPFSVMRSRIW
jgi:hypothetical protein